MFTLKIATDNAAFGDNELDARATLRYLLVTQVSDGLETSANGGTIRDENGNTCGEWSLVDTARCVICHEIATRQGPARYAGDEGRPICDLEKCENAEDQNIKDTIENERHEVKTAYGIRYRESDPVAYPRGERDTWHG